MPGRSFARAPVATMIFGASSCSLPPVEVTSSLPRPLNEAVPAIWVTLYLRKSISTPFARRSATPRLRLITFAQSKPTVPLMVTPKSAACCTVRITSADFSRAFVGMQPQLRQMPPARSRSTQATFSPSCAARMAAG